MNANVGRFQVNKFFLLNTDINILESSSLRQTSNILDLRRMLDFNVVYK